MSESVTHETMQRARETVDQLGTQACGMVRNAQATADNWTQKAEANLGTLRNAASDYLEEGQKRAQELGRSVSGKVQERPAAAPLVAAGIGFIAAVILNRR